MRKMSLPQSVGKLAASAAFSTFSALAFYGTAGPAMAATAAATVASTAAPTTKPTATLERGQQIAGAVCVACHGADGNSPSPANPILAGQSEQYIAMQLAAFKVGARKNALMQGFAANLTPDDMKSLGMYYSRQAIKPSVATDKALAARGAEIYRAGIRQANVPACAGCHGSAGQGIPSQYPRLGGQYAEYSYEQLGTYASGARKHAIMTTIAKRMLPEDRRAVSEYMAGLRETKVQVQ